MQYQATPHFKSRETTLAAIISQAAPVEKIYLLGSRLQQQQTAGIFMPAAPSCQTVQHYWLLVLIDKDCGYNENNVQDKIENNCRQFTPVTTIVLTTTQFNQWLQQGHRFACKVVNSATLLHDQNGIPLATPGNSSQTSPRKGMRPAGSIQNVHEFMAGATLYGLRQQYKMAAFMLHQAAEQALLAIFKNATGLYLGTHNIDKLLRYCALVNHEVPAVFSRETATGERQFQLLQKAYIDSRYKDDYAINCKDLQALTAGIETLQRLLEESAISPANNHSL